MAKKKKETWPDMSKRYLKWHSDVVQGKITLDSSIKLWTFNWLEEHYNPPTKK